jgi:hypothetical protein
MATTVAWRFYAPPRTTLPASPAPWLTGVNKKDQFIFLRGDADVLLP